MNNSRTHGRGKKSGRGSGKRGGRGNSGLHKHRFMELLKYKPDHFGDYGFKRHKYITKEFNPLNIQFIEDNFDVLQERGVIVEENEIFVINLKDLGANKLLGRGTPSRKYLVKAEMASKGAIEKIQSAEGEVELDAQG